MLGHSVHLIGLFLIRAALLFHPSRGYANQGEREKEFRQIDATTRDQDVVSPLLGRPLSSRESILVTRVLIVLIGAALIIVGIWVSLPDRLWPYLIITGSVWLSGATTCMLGGMYWSRASSTGATIGLLAGFIQMLALFVEPIQRTLAGWLGHLNAEGVVDTAQVSYYINNYSIMVAGYVAVIVLFIVGSLLFPDRKLGPLIEGGN